MSDSKKVIKLLFLPQEFKKIIREKNNIISEAVNKIELSPSGEFKWIILEISKDFIFKCNIMLINREI